MEVGVFIKGDTELAERFDNMPRAVHDALREVLFGNIGPELYDSVEAVIPRRTGSLASKLVLRQRDSQSRISVAVTFSDEFAKAGALEYGGSGRSFRVSAHTMRLAHLWGRAIGSPMLVDVPDMSRAITTPAKRFMRGPFEEVRAGAEAEMRAAVDEATAAE